MTLGSVALLLLLWMERMPVVRGSGSSAQQRSARFRLSVNSTLDDRLFHVLLGGSAGVPVLKNASSASPSYNRTRLLLLQQQAIAANTPRFVGELNAALTAAGVIHIVLLDPNGEAVQFATVGVVVTPRACGVISGYGGGLWTYADPLSGVCHACTVCAGQYQEQTCGLTDTVCTSACTAGSYARVGGAIGTGALGSCTLCRTGMMMNACGHHVRVRL